MNDEERWQQLLRGDASRRETKSLLIEACGSLDELLTSNPRAGEEVQAVLTRRLSGNVDPDTWPLVEEGLTTFGGTHLGQLVKWIVPDGPGDVSRIETFERYCSEPLRDFVRAILSIYGVDLREALELWGEFPEGWRRIVPYVYADVETREYYLKFRVSKFNGDEIGLEGTPDSFLQLVTNIARTLEVIDTRAAFSDDAVEAFRSAASDFLGVVDAETNGEAPSAAVRP